MTAREFDGSMPFMLNRALTLLALSLPLASASAQPASAPSPASAPAPLKERPAPPRAAPAPARPTPTPAPARPATPPDLTLLRIDLEDGFALHPWIYHEVRLSERWGILGDVHAQAPGLNPRFPAFLEIDVGPVLHLGPLQINPQIGIDLAWRAGEPNDPQDTGHTRAADFIPALYLILSWERVNAESWNLFFIPFDGSDKFYLMRLLATMRIIGGLAVGPHVEGFFFLRRKDAVDRLAAGGDVVYTFRWGQLGLFLAWEKQRNVAEMRLTFVREL